MSSFALPFAIAVALIVYMVCLSLVPKNILKQSDPRLKTSLRRLKQEQVVMQEAEEPLQDADSQYLSSPVTRAFLFIPGTSLAMPLIRKAGYAGKIERLLIGGLAIFLLIATLTAKFGMLAILFGIMGAWLVVLLFLKSRIKARKRKFLDDFPDALDMIVRSVRSGYPLNAALGMVAENMVGVIGIEFKRIVDEIRYGWTPYEALNRFADRIKEQDIRFFVTVLAVQQETGGNLSEVLTNLSKVLRQRKMLRLKIRALSSEGRATAWILGSLPLFIFTVLSIFSPSHLTPLYDTTAGHMIVAAVFGMVTTGMLIVKAMINIEI